MKAGKARSSAMGDTTPLRTCVAGPENGVGNGKATRNSTRPKKRASNIELLRIVSMFLIILHHFCVHGPWGEVVQQSSRIAIDVLSIGGKVGVACFVLITGYFSCHSHFNARGLLKVVLQTWFYSWVIWALFKVVAPQMVPAGFGLKYSLFPVISSEYWFVSCYVALVLFSPALNNLVTRLDSIGRSRLIAIEILVLSLIPTVFGVAFVFSNLAMFVCFYTIGADIRLTKDKKERRFGLDVLLNPTRLCRRFSPLVACLASLLFIVLSIFFIVALRRAGLLPSNLNDRYFMELNSVPIVLMSVGLFLLFKNLRLKSSRIINTLASAAFGVYLIHDNPLVRGSLWRVFRPCAFMPFWLIAAIGILAAAGIYVACYVVDSARRKLVERPVLMVIDRYCSHLLARTNFWFRALEAD